MALIANYPMQDDAASTTVVASTGSNATLGGGDNTSAKTVAGPGGLFPKALALNGTDDFIQTPTISFGSRIVCVSCWLNMAWVSQRITFESGTNFNSGTNANPRFASLSYSGSNQEQLGAKGTLYNARVYTGSYSAWRHYVYIFDTNQATADGAQVDLYIDGVLQVRAGVTNSQSTTTSNFQDNPLYIGSRAGTSLFRAMSIAGFKVYNHRLDQSEIDALLLEGADTTTGLIANYPMQDDAASTTVVASTGSNATLGGGDNTSSKTVTGPGGLFPKALALNGTDDFIQTPTISFGSRIVCVSFWINTSSSNNEIIYESSTNYGSGTNANPRFAMFSGPAGQETVSIKGTGLNFRRYTGSFGAWKHFVSIHDTTQSNTDGAQVDLYIDGVLQTRLSINDAATSTSNFEDNPIYIGSRAGTSLFRDMSIAGFKVYNRRLKQADINDLFDEKNAIVGKSKFIYSSFCG